MSETTVRVERRLLMYQILEPELDSLEWRARINAEIWGFFGLFFGVAVFGGLIMPDTLSPFLQASIAAIGLMFAGLVGQRKQRAIFDSIRGVQA